MLQEIPGRYNRIHNILIAAGIYTLTPFLIISQYNRPSADDYTFAVRYSQHSLAYVIRDTYLNWSGRYFATLIAALDPVKFNVYTAYKFLPIVFIIMFAAAIFFLVKELTKEYLNLRQKLALSSLMVYLYMAAAPSVSEAFYWFPAACFYHLANVFFLLLLVQLSKLQKAKTKNSRLFHFLCACLLAVLIIGSNEISMLITVFSILLFTVYSVLCKKERVEWFIFLCALSIAASAFASFAPGNFKRLEYFQEFARSPIWSISGAGGVTLFYFLQWALSILVASLIYIPFIGMPLASKFSFDKLINALKFKWLIFLFAAFIIFLQLFAVWFAGGSNLGRIENVIYFFFLLVWFFLLQFFLNLFFTEEKTFLKGRLFNSIAVMAFVVSVFDLNNNITTAYIDIFSGKAAKYHNELSERDKIVKLCKTDTCVVPSLKNIPKTIFFTDIKSLEDTTELWINHDYSSFMHSGYVLTATPLPPLQSNLETIRETGKKFRSNLFK